MDDQDKLRQLVKEQLTEIVYRSEKIELVTAKPSQKKNYRVLTIEYKQGVKENGCHKTTNRA